MNSHATIPVELKLFQREEIVIIQVREERVLSENRLKGKRQSDRKKQEVKGESKSRKTHKKVREDTKIGRIRREEREREQERRK